MCAAAVAAIAMAGTLVLISVALTEYKSKDFVKGTEVTDWDSYGTCVGTITRDQLDTPEGSWMKDSDASCDDAHRDRAARSLQVSVHGLYYTWNKNYADKGVAGVYDVGTADPATWTGLDEEKKFTFGPVARVAISSIGMAGANHCPTCPTATGGTVRASNDRALDFVYPAVNMSDVFHALSEVSEYANADGVPTSCETIYTPLKATDVLDGTTDDAKQAREYMKAIIEMDSGKKEEWPIGKLNINCNEGATAINSGGAVSADGTHLLGEDMDMSNGKFKLFMFAHCLTQFRYASVGTPVPHDGAFGLPTPGTEAGPGWRGEEPEGYSDLINTHYGQNYTARVRLYQGQRFGYALWTYVPIVVAAAYFCADAILFFTAEALYPLVIREMENHAQDQIDLKRNSLIIAATSKLSRRRRFTIGLGALLFVGIFWLIYSFSTFGLYDNKMPRPICDDTGGMGKDQDYENVFIDSLFKDTKGGWKQDWNSVFNEVLTMLAMLLVLFLLPITTLAIFNSCNRGIPDPTGGSNASGKSGTLKIDTKPQSGKVRGVRYYVQTQTFFCTFIFIAGLVLIIGHAIASARFGQAWAEGVLDKKDGDGNIVFQETQLAEHVYNQGVAVVLFGMVVGFVVGAVTQRHLLKGIGFLGSTYFFAWVAFLVVFCLPVLVIGSYHSFFDEPENNDECGYFASDSFTSEACAARFWTTLIAGAVILLLLGILILRGCLVNIPKIMKVEKQVTVNTTNNKVTSGAGDHPTLTDKEVSNRVVGNSSAPYNPADASQHYVLGGYRSHDEDFYSWKSKPKPSTNAMLYAPRISFQLPMSTTGRTGSARYAPL